jgi:hypothetical protein
MVSTAGLTRWSGAALIAGGALIAAFVLVHPQGEFTPAVMASGIAQIAHSLHFLGATLAAFGFIGVLLRLQERGGRLGLAGGVLTFFGTVWFAGLGLMSFAALPFIAQHDPALMAPDGAFWNGAPNPVFLVGLASFALGHVALGVAVLRGVVGLPRWSGPLLILGALLSALPPVVVPTVVLTAGGVLLGAGWAWLGWALWSRRANG